MFKKKQYINLCFFKNHQKNQHLYPPKLLLLIDRYAHQTHIIRLGYDFGKNAFF